MDSNVSAKPADAQGRGRNRAALLAAAIAIALAALVVALARLSIDPAVTEAAGAMNARALAPLWLAAAALWLALTAAWRGMAATSRGRAAGATVFILAVAAAARLAVVATHDVSLSDDVYRYAFDGRNGAHGVNPYTVKPEEAAGAEDGAEAWPGERRLALLVNNPELHTIYLPGSQCAFTAVAWLLPETVTDPATVARVFRAAIVAVDLLMIVLILALLRAHGRSPWWAILYAWHPLPIIEIAGSGHQDVLGVALLVLALVLHARRPAAALVWTIPLALAVCVKPVVIPLAAYMLRGRPARDWLISLATGVVTCAAVCGPFLLGEGGRPLRNLLETTRRFGLKWAHFGPVYEPLLALVGRLTPGWTNDPQEQLVRLVLLVALLAVLAWLFVRRRDPVRSCRDALFAMVLLSSTAHPWYLLWALVLMPLAPAASLWIASLTILWGYAAWTYTTGDDGALRWGAGPLVLAAAWLPVAAALMWGWRAGRGIGH